MSALHEWDGKYVFLGRIFFNINDLLKTQLMKLIKCAFVLNLRSVRRKQPKTKKRNISKFIGCWLVVCCSFAVAGGLKLIVDDVI